MALIKKVADETVNKAVKANIISLYRRFAKAMPKIIVMYNLPYSVGELRHLLMLHFRRHDFVSDSSINNTLVLKGEEKYQELIDGSWTEYHVRHFIHQETMTVPRQYNEYDMEREFLYGPSNQAVEKSRLRRPFTPTHAPWQPAEVIDDLHRE